MENTERTQEDNLCEFIFKTDDKKQEASLFGIILSEKDRNMRPESALAKCHIYGAPQRNSPETIVIPSHDPKTGYPVTALENNAFSGMSQMKHLFIPETVTRIDWHYYGLRSLEKIIVDNANPAFRDLDGVLFTKDMTELIAYPDAREAKEYFVPQGVRILRPHSFSGCNIENLYLPETVTEIGCNAFYKSRVRVICPSGLKTIHEPKGDSLYDVIRFTFNGTDYSYSDLCARHPELIK